VKLEPILHAALAGAEFLPLAPLAFFLATFGALKELAR
jgi:hypothetical protein